MTAANTDESKSGSHAALDEAVRRLVERLQPERIYLFGSRARGDATAGSDCDLLVVVPQGGGSSYRQEVAAYDALFDLNFSKDLIVLSRADFDGQARAAASLPATVLREGLLLYAA
jgi:predicted nucleotidyltransferase